MSSAEERYTGGCLCGALCYEADGEPMMTGHCHCEDCGKASGSGFVPFIGFASSAVRPRGQTRKFVSKSARGHGCRAQLPSRSHQPGIRPRNWERSFFHDLRGFPRRPVVVPSKHRNLHSRSVAVGCHSARPHPSPLLSLHSLELGTATAGVRHRLSITRWEGAVSCGPGASPEPWRLDSWPAGHGCAQAVSHKAPWTMRRPPSRWGRIRMLLCNDQH
jgi:hypothetical protein